jgi:hypothetical protein
VRCTREPEAGNGVKEVGERARRSSVPTADLPTTRGFHLMLPIPKYHRTMLIVRISVLAAVWVVSACSAATPSGEPSRSLVPSSVQPTRLPDPASPGPSGSFDLPGSIIDPVVAEAARLAGVPVDQVTVTSGEAVTFPDGGLGCPVPGMAYTQVQVEGFKIVVEAGGASYDFRGTGPDKFRLCEKSAG